MTDLLESLWTPVVCAAVLATGLQAGTYYTWASGVMPGLGRVDDRTFVHTMQTMNVAIVNPVFLASFLGAPALALVAIAAAPDPARPWVVAGAVLAVATVAITGGRNVPLNNVLDAAGPVDEIPDPAVVRAGFESPWRRWNVARAVTSTAALACLTVAALRG